MQNTNLSDDFIGQRQRRLEKAEQLRKLGIDPFPAHSQKDLPNAEIKNNFDEHENKEVSLTGRMMSWRDHGKLIFSDLQDQSGRVQLYIRQDTLEGNPENGYLNWDQLELFDVGDYAEARGTVVKTTRGEISLLVKNIRVIAKTVRPLPNSLTEKEDFFRRRYLDLTVNPDRKEQFVRKARFWQASREWMNQHGFIEVEVPVLEHVTGGADARPFVTHHNELDQDFYLRISTELYQKRLIGGGFEKIYTVGPNFRNEGLSDEHLQEYYQIEWYWAYADYRDNMTFVRDMIRKVAQEVWGTTKFSTRGHEFDLNDDWTEIDYAGIIKEKYDVDIFNDSDEKMQTVVQAQGISLPGVINRARLIDNLWKSIRKTLAGPAFLVNEPKFMSPLAKSKPENPDLTERFHIVIGGSELGNGYTEINDPVDQLDRFLDQQKMRDQGDDEAQMLDIDYIEMLEYGMPPTSGYAHSERLFWYLENVTAREGTFFPQLKHEVDGMTRSVYEEKLSKYNVSLELPVSAGPDKSQAGKSQETKVAHAVILNDPELPDWARYNTVAHLSASLAAREGKKLLYIEQSKTTDGEVIPMNIQHAIMIKETDKAQRLLKLKREAEAAGTTVVCFTREMMASTDDRKVREEQEKKAAEEIGFLGVLVFGKKATVERLTKNFSLTKSGTSSGAPETGPSESSDPTSDSETSATANSVHTNSPATSMMTREEALKLVNDHIANKNLVKHCISVEGAMRALARHFGEDEELWGIIGLLHDADWEETASEPTTHTRKTVEWIKESGKGDDTVIRAVLAHAHFINGEPPPENRLEWSLFCCDELTGLITASALVTPEKKLNLLSIPSIMKKFRSKNFAAAVNREDIALCEEKLGIPIEEFTQIVLNGMIMKADELGL